VPTLISVTNVILGKVRVAKPRDIAAIRWEVEEKLIASHDNL
jgi:hypothetical protein